MKSVNHEAHEDHEGLMRRHRASRYHGKPVTSWFSFVFFVFFVVPSLAAPPAPAQQTVVDAEAKSTGCRSCHTATERHTMHQNPGVVLGCTDCHGGDAKVTKPDGAKREDAAYLAAL